MTPVSKNVGSSNQLSKTQPTWTDGKQANPQMRAAMIPVKNVRFEMEPLMGLMT